MKIFIFKIFLILQFSNVIQKTYADYENHVAFYCGHPSMVFTSGKWIIDFQQSCIKNEMEIVSYCRRTFPNKNITSAEPAMEKINFTRWCDFDDKNCKYNLEIRPFKCLNENFQSDALTIPEHCSFSHLGGKSDCKNYKDWVIDAKRECSKKSNWEVRSYGMLFQCGKSVNNIAPMFFKGVEFVCCPVEKRNNDKMDEKVIKESVFNDYHKNSIFETEKKEDDIYKGGLKKLDQSEFKILSEVTKKFKDGENDLKKLWKTDPQLAKFKEKQLISQFQTEFSATVDQFTSNKEKFLNFHEDRLKFIFTSKFEVAWKHLEIILNEPVKDENRIREAMEQILDLLMIRKKELTDERMTDENLGAHMLGMLRKELVFVENKINIIFKKLDQVPQFKSSIKQYLMKHLLNKYPRISFEKVSKTDTKKLQINKIIAKHGHKSETNDDEENDEFQVHYDLGLDDKDQSNHFGKSWEKILFDKHALENQFGHKNILFGLLASILATAFLILVFGSIFIIYRHRSAMVKYTQPMFQRKSMQGFGYINSSAVGKDIINGRPIHGYNNPNYTVVHTVLNTTQVSEKTKPDMLDENTDSQVI